MKQTTPDQTITLESIWEILQSVKDPELPAVSLVEMGIIRDVQMSDKSVHVIITPTFSGCPALRVMGQEIKKALQLAGLPHATVETILAPPWSSDWITEEGRRKLKAFGLAPPQKHGGNLITTFFDVVACPRCDSTNTRLQNSFGSTMCRAIWTCNNCQETFEQFKPL